MTFAVATCAVPMPSRHLSRRPCVTSVRSTASSSSSSQNFHHGRRDALLSTVATVTATSLSPPALAIGPDPVAQLTRRGMAKFTQGDVDGSVDDFDLVISAAPNRAPYLWQRGLSLYYAERYTEGSQQFRKDVAVNPNDTEEALWAFLCEARDPKGEGFDAARKNLLKVGRDNRAYMRAAYELFSGVGDEDALRATAASGGAAEDFYSWLYVGLYREAKGDSDGAKDAMLSAIKTPYGQKSGDYMAALAEVHARRRGWASQVL